jgi:putative phosphoesterase
MLLGVISDTHGNTQRTSAALRMLEAFEIEAVLHCGDIGSAAIPALITRWPAHFVLGNVDEYQAAELLEACSSAGHALHDLFADLALGGRRIAVTHSHRPKLFIAAETCGQYDLVCYGHTHQAEQHRAGNALILNPGALHRANPPTCAVVDLTAMTAEFLAVS